MLDMIHSEITTFVHYEQIPVTLGNFSEWRSVYFLPINDVKKGDLIQVFGEGEARNDMGYNIELAQVIEIRNTVSGGQEPLGGVYTGPINGWNITPDAHYGRFSKVGSWVANNDYPILYAVLRLRCRSTDAQNYHYVQVLPNQGLMFFNHYRDSNNKGEGNDV